jgi:hypothetical protein
MRRFLRWMMHGVLVIVVAVISFIVVDVAAAPGSAPVVLVNGLMAGGLGLALGLMVAWMRGVPWRLFPVLFRVGYRRLQQEFWWIVAGMGSAAVLVFY